MEAQTQTQAQTPRLPSRSAVSLTPMPDSGFNGVASIIVDSTITTAKAECGSGSTSRSTSPHIPRTIVHDGVTFDILRSEELDYEAPVFGERRRKIGASKTKKNLKKKSEEEEETIWEAKRRRLIQEKVLEKEFIGYTKEDTNLTEDGLWLPDMPAWLNMTRECQDDGSWGVFMARPSKDDIENRWQEILQAVEPLGVEIGAVKIALPSEYLDDHKSIEAQSHYISSTPSTPRVDLQNVPSPPTPTVPTDSAHSNSSRSPRLASHSELIPPPQLDKNGTPKIWIVDQRLPLHPCTTSNLTPIYRVSSANKRQIRGSHLLTSIRTYTDQQHAIAAGDPHTEIFAPLTEAVMLARGRSWERIAAGDTGGVSLYSSDNDADPYTRAYIGVGNPHLTSLPGNMMFDSRCKIVGIHTPFFYFGAAHTMFALHAEDYNAMSLNYHHFGADKIWRVVSPRCYHVVEDFVASHIFDTVARKGRKLPEKRCSQFVRHASIYLPGPTLDTIGARSIQFRQRPGELVITWPLAYHEGYNEGLNINEACGYGHKGWRRVFATGEEEKGEEAVYRPCGEKCMGKAHPIILDFEPEAQSEGEGDDGISNIGGDEEVAMENSRSSSLVGQASRKRSRMGGSDCEDHGARAKRPRPKKKIPIGSEDPDESRADSSGLVNGFGDPGGAKGDEQSDEQAQLSLKIEEVAEDVGIFEIERSAEKAIDSQEAGNGNGKIADNGDLEMANDDRIESEKAIDPEMTTKNREMDDVKMTLSNNDGHARNTGGPRKKTEDDQLGVEGVSFVPVQLDDIAALIFPP